MNKKELVKVLESIGNMVPEGSDIMGSVTARVGDESLYIRFGVQPWKQPRIPRAKVKSK